VARRKGLTFAVVRRMKEVYPRAVDIVERGVVDIGALVTHRFPLRGVADAFSCASTRQGLKVVVEVSS